MQDIPDGADAMSGYELVDSAKDPRDVRPVRVRIVRLQDRPYPQLFGQVDHVGQPSGREFFAGGPVADGGRYVIERRDGVDGSAGEDPNETCSEVGGELQVLPQSNPDLVRAVSGGIVGFVVRGAHSAGDRQHPDAGGGQSVADATARGAVQVDVDEGVRGGAEFDVAGVAGLQGLDDGRQALTRGAKSRGPERPAD